ncbi:MAG TPA: serine/threonine-protein kinase [Archangium sp.]|jgi:serine/threonine-protein kinase|uniref:serine/threonine-protein kinase n=1 Tax=Archangium sp. TaxID=1872627 RepID=UPI002EDB4D50
MTQPAASDIRVGAVLQDTYEITSLLGKGGMGAVFLARHRRLPGRQVAVKVLLNGAGLNPELFARFRREAEIASQLGHPNIVEVLDFDTLPDGTPFLLMEYLRGESLEERLSRGPLPLAEALAIVRQMGSALQAAHRAGVVHRDLKPANVFLIPSDTGERVKLLDFGISKILDSQTLKTQESVLIGTPQYMAPEQALGKNSEVDARTDLFALGCIVYEMLSGTPPFAGEGSSIVQVVFRIVHTHPEPLASRCPNTPAQVVAAVERALSKDPRDRYPDVATFIAELTGSPLQSQSGAGAAILPSSRTPSAPATPATDDVGFAATFAPSSTARLPAPAPATPATDEVGFAATLVPSTESRPPPPVPSVSPQAMVSPSEATRAATPELRRARVKPLAPLALATVAVVLGVAVSNGWFKARPAPESGVPVVVTAPPPVVEPVPMPPGPPEAVPPTAVSAPTPAAPPERKPARQAASEVIPEAVRGDLEEAARALAAGDIEEALRFASRSQRTQKTDEAVSLLARAYCRKGDLSNARAQWRLLARPERIRVRLYCKQYMEL